MDFLHLRDASGRFHRGEVIRIDGEMAGIHVAHRTRSDVWEKGMNEDF